MNKQSETGVFPVVIGIVGGIAAGKSFVTKEFIAQGAEHFDADKEAKELYNLPSVVSEIKKRWPTVVDSKNVVDKSRLAQIVFSPTEQGARELSKLNALLHPILNGAFITWLKKRQDARLVILDAPLLLEAGMDSLIDYLVYVDADFAVRQKRAVERGWEPDEIIRRESRQLPLCEKKERADFCVNSSSSSSQVREQVAKIVATLFQGSR
ncbi:MAG: dephospho-CoA kinase [Thermoguttaceae bacterium]